MINLIVGRTGSGKDYLAEQLQKRGLKVLKSYTTRPKRTEDEDTHIFITPEEVDNYPNKVATTCINGYDYFATADQVKNCDVYIIDPNGIKELTDNIKNVAFNIIHVNAAPEDRRFYAVRRVALKDKIKEEEIFNQRSENENEQFSAFEDEMTAYENGMTSLPPNVTTVMPYYNHYNEEETQAFVNSVVEYTHLFKKMHKIILEIAQNTEECANKIILSDNGNVKALLTTGEYSPEVNIEVFTDEIISNEGMCLDVLLYYLNTSHRFDDLL